MAEYREGLIEDIDELASKIGDFKSQLDALSTIADLTGKNTGKVAENLRKASAEAAKANTAIAKTKYETLTS
jgi:outer membrane murein-binding lipoprotein Lpp